MLRIVLSASNNPYENLALEEVLLHSCEDEQDHILYLWQNENTVVIGRNQNVYTECNMDSVKKYKTLIARRLTGGGAVYHDLGNLNFTIIVPYLSYDRSVSSSVIVDALNMMGVSAKLTGRNDIVYDGLKFSGSAYYSSAKAGLHHGTIMVDVDLDKMQKLLYTTGSKIAKKGVSSVKSRVVNLLEINPDITIDALKNTIEKAFIKTYGDNEIPVYGIRDDEKIAAVQVLERYSSERWNFKQVEEYDAIIEEKYNWGYIKLSCSVNDQTERIFSISSDSLYPDLMDTLENSLNANDDTVFSALRLRTDTATEKSIIDAVEQLYHILTKNIAEDII